jgi:hypothetical protein
MAGLTESAESAAHYVNKNPPSTVTTLPVM